MSEVEFLSKEEVEKVTPTNVVVEEDKDSSPLYNIRSFWDDEQVLVTAKNGKVHRKCGWCGFKFSRKNFMKAIYYLSIIAGHDIGPYSGNISKQYRERYANICKKIEQGREASARAKMITRKVIIHHQSNMVNAKGTKLNGFFYYY